MMKRLLKTTLMLLAMLLPANALAYDFEVDGIFYNIINDNEVEVTHRGTSSNTYSGAVTIPPSVTYNGTTYSVTTIGENAFYECTGLTSVNIPNSVTTIRFFAFWNCTGLTSIYIPNSVTDFSEYSFYLCAGLTSIIVDSDNPKYDSRDNCNAIIETESNTLVFGCKNTIIPNSVTSIGDDAFEQCRGLTSITIPNSVTSIGFGAFCCSGLTSVTIPKSVTSIGRHAFASCSDLTRASIPSRVTSIGDAAFYNCNGLNDVYSFIEDPSQITMGTNVFARNDGEYPTRTLYVNTWRYMDDSRWSQYFDNFQIPRFEVDGIYYKMTDVDEVCITSGGNYTGEVIIPETVTYDGITYPVTAIGEMAFYCCHELSSVTIPNSITTIGREAFEASGLTSIVIPSSVTFIDEYAFIECDALQSMVVDMDNPVYDSRENCNAIIETASNILISGCHNAVIPNTVIAIGDYAFEYCTGLTRISIPNSVVTIGNGAFYDCTGLTSVEFGNSVTIIDEEAFEGCSSLTSVVIPNSVTFIGFEAFAYCSSLTSATISKSLTTIEDRIFYYCSNLTDVYCYITDPTNISMGDEVFYKYPKEYSGRTLHVPAGSVPLYQASDKWYPYFGQIVEMSVISGDVDGDGVIGIGDVTGLIDMILRGDISILSNPAADMDGDGTVGIADVTSLVDRLLSGN